MLNKILIRTLALVAISLLNRQTAIAETPYIDSVQGNVELKRKTVNEAGFRVIKRGPVSLSVGDQLRLGSGAVATIICPGKNKPREIRQAGERLGVQKLCPEWKAIVKKGPPPLIAISGTNPQIPFLITPRRTLILDPKPTIRWNPVPGSSQYTVKIVNAQGIVWQTQVKESQVTYSGTSALQPGIPYSITIQTNTGKASQSEAGSEFILLRDAEAKVVQAAVNQIAQSDFNADIKALKLVDYYSTYEVPEPLAYGLSEKTAKSYRLNADAIATLKTLIAQDKQSPLIYRTLGDLYLQTGVMAPAENAYLRAIETVQSLEDLEEWSLTLYGLGELYEVTQNLQQALIFYSQAKAGFILLNDQRAEGLNRDIARLRK